MPAIMERGKSTTLNLFLNIISLEGCVFSPICLFFPPGYAFTKICDTKTWARKPRHIPDFSTTWESRIKCPHVFSSKWWLLEDSEWGCRGSRRRVGRGIVETALGSFPPEPGLPGLQLGDKGTWLRLAARASFQQTIKACAEQEKVHLYRRGNWGPGRLNELPGFLCRADPGFLTFERAELFLWKVENTSPLY